MKKNLLLMGGLSMLLGLGACGNTDIPTPNPEPVVPQEISVSFLANLERPSRAGDANFDERDAISVFALSVSDGQPSLIQDVNRYDNIKYVYNGIKFLPDDGYGVVKADGEKLAYAAIYPYAENRGNTFAFTAYANQREGLNYTNSDLATAATSASENSEVSLTFYHRLSQIVVNVEGDDLTGDLDIKFNNLMLSANVNLNEMKFEASGEPVGTIIPAINGLNSWKAVVAPQQFRAGTPIATVVLNGEEIPLMPQNDLNLASGKSYQFTATIINNQMVEFEGEIMPWNSGSIESVVPEEVREQWGEYITIHDGINPPNIEGCYFIDPMATIYCADQGNGGYDPGLIVTSTYINFSNQNMLSNTINMEDVTETWTAYSRGPGAFISGEGNDFTVFFNTEGESNGIWTKTALVVSGTKTESGIKDLEYAFVMVDKGDDPNNILMNVNVFRVFKDEDGMAENTTWPGINMRPAFTRSNLFDAKANVKK